MVGKRRIKSESFENVKRVVTNDNMSTIGGMGIVMADAYNEAEENDKHIKKVNDELKTQFDDTSIGKASKSKSDDAKAPVTAKLTLDEKLEDFSVSGTSTSRVYEEDDSILDYDMFNFIYDLVASETDGRFKHPLPVPGKRVTFRYHGQDKYTENPDRTSNVQEETQIAVGDNYIELYSDDVKKFDQVIAICGAYKLKYRGPQAKRNLGNHWPFSFRIYIPQVNNYPELAETYFEKIGIPFESVVSKEFLRNYNKALHDIEKQKADYYVKKQKEAERLAKATKKAEDKEAVSAMIDSAIVTAARDNREPLGVHLDRLFKALDDAGLPYIKREVRQTFNNAFDDSEFED